MTTACRRPIAFPLILLLAALSGAALPVAAGARPALRPMPGRPPDVTDAQIERAIHNGAHHLLSRFNARTFTLNQPIGADDGLQGTRGLAVPPRPEARRPTALAGGVNALAVYALLQSGRALPDEPRLDARNETMKNLLEAMKRFPLDNGRTQVYSHAVRAAALSVYNRPEDRAALAADVDRLVGAHQDGGYSYRADGLRDDMTGPFDNSNSQYGLMGVWSGAEAGVEVPTAYWRAAEAHWTRTQFGNGMWAYREPDAPRSLAGGRGSGRDPSLSMTVAGVASLLVTHDYLDGPKFVGYVGRPPYTPALKRGLDWLEQGDNAIARIPPVDSGYTLFGLERVGLASGYKYFGDHDWYPELALKVVAAQRRDGSWGPGPIETSFALLFLARGRHPILMNKLRFDGHWANRPRDAANLARFAGRRLERELNWQVVPLRRPWHDWADAPVLYLASHAALELAPADVDNLRSFVQAGGLLFTHADGDKGAFNAFAERLATDLFPKYEMRDLPPDHALYSAVYKVDPKLAGKLKLRSVDNGARLLMVHSPTDVARHWQLRDSVVNKGFFEFGVNLFAYAAGKRDFRFRLQSPYVSDPGDPPNGAAGVARLEYGGNWDPEPYAWTRFDRWLRRQTGTGADVHTVKLADLRSDSAPLAHLTGTARWDFSDAEAAAVKAYVEAGGVLLVDACGGTGSFDAAVREGLLAKAFPGAELRRLAADHPLLRDGAPGMDDLSAVRVRPYAAEFFKHKYAEGHVFALRAGRGHVIFTPLDLTNGLLGTRTWGIAGFHPDWAQAFVKNVVFWTLDGTPE